MKLRQPVYDNGYIAIASLPGGQMLPNGFTCYITGWGYIDSENIFANL